MLQELSNTIYKRFISDVQACRPQLQELAIEEWANGKIFTAEQGLALGMVDILGSQYTVEQTIKTLTKDDHEISLVFPSAPTFMYHMDKQKLAINALVDAFWNRLEQKIQQSGHVSVSLN